MSGQPAGSPRAAKRHRLGTTAIVLVALGSALILQWPGWAQTSYFLLTDSFSHGTAKIDSKHWQTGDKSWINGHFYSVKAPGMPALLVPPYVLLKETGFEGVSKHFGDAHPLKGSRQGAKPSRAQGKKPDGGASSPRTPAVMRQINRERLMIWALGLFGTVLPSLLLMFLVRRDAEEISPGTGTPTALALGLGTMLLPFSSQLFGHVLGSMLLYLAFHLAFKERRSEPRLALLAAAGAVTGLAVDVEYPLAFGGAVVGIYALARQIDGSWSAKAAALRAAAFGAGGVAALIPLAIYNRLAFGSVTAMSYNGAVAVEGKSGHARLGLNDGGFFGIGIPNPRDFIDILISPRGILSITPICLIGLIGVFWMRSRGRRAESNVVLGVMGIYVIYVSGYWLPFGGGSPGPRFLTPVMPFLALGIAQAWRRIPVATLVLATAGATVMGVASVAGPLVSPAHVVWWWERIGGLPQAVSILSGFGIPTGAPSLVPVYFVWIAAIALGILASRLPGFTDRRQIAAGAGALAGWLLLALVVSPAVGERKILPGGPAVGLPPRLVLLAAAMALLAAAGAGLSERRNRAAGSPAR